MRRDESEASLIRNRIFDSNFIDSVENASVFKGEDSVLPVQFASFMKFKAESSFRGDRDKETELSRLTRRNGEMDCLFQFLEKDTSFLEDKPEKRPPIP